MNALFLQTPTAYILLFYKLPPHPIHKILEKGIPKTSVDKTIWHLTLSLQDHLKLDWRGPQFHDWQVFSRTFSPAHWTRDRVQQGQDPLCQQSKVTAYYPILYSIWDVFWLNCLQMPSSLNSHLNWFLYLINERIEKQFGHCWVFF